MNDSLQAFAAIVGPGHVVSGDAARAAERTTYAAHGKVLGLVRPGSVEEVVACVRTANTIRTPLYPISGGKNWGYGSRTPPRGSCVVLDLSRLHGIVDYDEDLAFVTVQCGVTFAQLAEFLTERGATTFGAAIGGPGNASVIGNLVERGLGKGPLADRFLHSCDFEVVLPTGELVRTGFGRFDEAQASATHRFGVGPYLDGMFSQSNLGIVTQATLWLRPRPKHVTSLVYVVDEEDRLAPLIDALRTLRLEGTLQSSVLVANDVRRLSFAGGYPWDAMGGATPLSLDVRRKLRTSGAWSGDASVYAPTERMHDAILERVTDVLGPVTSRIARSDRVDPSTPLARALNDIQQLAVGAPLEGGTRTAYFRKRTPPPPDDQLDPDRDRCGFVSFSPALPFVGDAATEAAALIEDIFPRFGFDPNIGFNCVSERSIDMTPMMLFDRDVPGEDERAAACHRTAFEAFAARGYVPYRLTTESMAWLPHDNAFARLVRTLKATLDPAGILAPGRYDFSEPT